MTMKQIICQDISQDCQSQYSAARSQLSARGLLGYGSLEKKKEKKRLHNHFKTMELEHLPKEQQEEL
jgi:hypothetical protein